MVKAKFTKGLPEFKLELKVVAQILNDMADAAINTIYNDTLASKDIHGKKFQRLAPATLRAKKAKGQSSKPLIAEGIMSKVRRGKTASAGSLKSTVTVADERKDIAEFHIEGAGNLPKRKFFGIGKPLEGKLDKVIKLRVEKLIKTTMKKK